MKKKVIIADDHQLFREGLSNLLISVPDIEVIGQAENGKELLDLAERHNPDVVLADIAMPVMNGIETTQKLKKKFPGIKVIMVSMHSDRQYVKGSLEAGADGYLLKNCTYLQLTDAIRSVNEGKKYISEDITEMIINGYLTPGLREKDELDLLSEREKEVLLLYADGKSTKEIGEQLFISVKTVGTHKQNIQEKLGLKNNADIVKYAIKKGLTEIS